MKSKHILVVLSLSVSAICSNAIAKCPTSIEEAGIIAPKLLIQEAVAHKAYKGITDFSPELGKSAGSGIVGIGGYDQLYLVQAIEKNQELTGVLKCDKDQFVVLSIAWKFKKNSGVLALPVANR